MAKDTVAPAPAGEQAAEERHPKIEHVSLMGHLATARAAAWLLYAMDGQFFGSVPEENVQSLRCMAVDALVESIEHAEESGERLESVVKAVTA